MLNRDRTALGAVLPLAAAIAVVPVAAAAPAATSPHTPSAGTAVSAPLTADALQVATTTPASAATTPSVPRSGRLVRVLDRQLTLASGSTVAVRARTTTVPVHVELRVGRHGRVVASADAAPGTRFRLQGRAHGGEQLWLRARRTDGGVERSSEAVGTVRSMRQALASWYGPGLYGQRTACGQTLTTGLRGVAHKSLACGTKLTLRYRGRTTTAIVVDRGPYAGGRELDLTTATARALGFGAVGHVWVSR